MSSHAQIGTQRPSKQRVGGGRKRPNTRKSLELSPELLTDLSIVGIG